MAMSVSKRKENGKWGYRVYFRGRNWRRFTFKTREDALQAEAELLDKLRREMMIIRTDMPLVEAVNKYLEYSAKVGKSAHRLRGMHSCFKSFIVPFLKPETRIKDITHNNIQAFIEAQLKRNISRTTIHHYLIDLNSLLNWALKEEVISSNPMKKVNRKQTRPEKVIKRCHTPEQVSACEAALDGEERLFFRFLRFTGARLTEALTAEWADVDYKNREIIVRGTKTEESLRRLPICDGLFETLKGLEKYRKGSDYLFHHDNGERILRRDKVFVKIFEKTGIRITAKDLRDYFASMIAAGIDGFTPDIVTVSRLLGHTNLTTTNKYLYTLRESMKSAVGVLDKMENLSPKISPETQEEGLAHGLTPRNHWWRRRDLNPGHYGYEPYALTN